MQKRLTSTFPPQFSPLVSRFCAERKPYQPQNYKFILFFLVEPKLLPVSLCIKWHISRQPKFDSLGSANNSQAPNSFASKKMENSAIGAEHWKIKRLYFVFFGHKRKNSTYIYYTIFYSHSVFHLGPKLSSLTSHQHFNICFDGPIFMLDDSELASWD